MNGVTDTGVWGQLDHVTVWKIVEISSAGNTWSNRRYIACWREFTATDEQMDGFSIPVIDRATAVEIRRREAVISNSERNRQILAKLPVIFPIERPVVKGHGVVARVQAVALWKPQKQGSKLDPRSPNVLWARSLGNIDDIVVAGSYVRKVFTRNLKADFRAVFSSGPRQRLS